MSEKCMQRDLYLLALYFIYSTFYEEEAAYANLVMFNVSRKDPYKRHWIKVDCDLILIYEVLTKD